MNSRRSTVDSRQPGRLPFSQFLLLFALVLASLECASSGPRAVVLRDRFPLDPREELAGPFPEGVEKGWGAILRGDYALAEREFEAARTERARTAADIGWIEAIVLSGKSEEPLAACKDMMPRGEATLPLLVACAEANARAGRPPEAHDLYRLALARTGGSRAEELRIAAAEAWGTRAKAAAAEKRWQKAREEIGRAIALEPESAALRAAAGDIERGAGERAQALRRYREALELEPKDPATLEKAGDLAVSLGEHALAVSVYGELARRDPRFAAKAAEARMAFRVANWPVPEREAALSEDLTRAGAAQLVWWMFPEVREARVSAGPIASDAVSRKDSRAVTRAVGLGLLDVDRDTHRSHPDAPLTLAAASRLLLRLLSLVRQPSASVPCLAGEARAPRSAAEAIRRAKDCGLLVGEEGSAVSGGGFTRALDGLRALASGGAGTGGP